MLAPGTRVGRFEVEGPLGSGGMGTVYRARDPELLRSVALKILTTEEADESARVRFLREARAAARLHHAHAVTVFEVGQTEDKRPYIAMELVKGDTLRDILAKKSKPDIETRVRWLRQIAEVLHAAHAAGLVHRDVKPENVMIRASDRSAKVLDFGIARAPTFAEGDGLAAITGDGEIVGTLAFMAPEQLRAEPIDGRADQFGWGVTAFEVLVGRLPWKEKQSMRLATEIMGADGVSPRDAGAPIPASLDAVVRTALRKNRSDRFTDMQQLLLELDEVEAELVQGTDETETAVRVPTTATTKPSESRPEEQRQTRSAWWLVGIGVVAIGAGIVAAAKKPPVAGPKPPVVPSADGRSHCPRPGADDAYERALRAWRVESEHVAAREMELAVTADASCGAARLWLAYFYYPVDPPKGRSHFAAARSASGSLSDRDKALLVASEPYFDDPPDFKEWASRMRALGKAHPDDSEIGYREAYASWRAADANGALEAAGRSSKIDPGAIRPRWLSAMVHAELRSDLDSAIKELEKCVVAIPGASACHGQRAIFLAEGGRCQELETATRSWLARAPSSANARLLLASALVARNAPRTAVEQAWIEGSDRMLDSGRKETKARGLARIALREGDFETAETEYRIWITESESREDVDGRLGPIAELAAVQQARGKKAEVQTLSAELERESALTPDSSVWWLTTQDTVLAPALVLAVASGRDVEKHREDWITRALAWEKNGQAPIGFAWLTGVARFVRTPEQARLAWRSDLPKPDPTHWWPAQLSAWLGETYVLGAKPADGVPLLERAALACDGWTWPAGEHARAKTALESAKR